MCSLAVTTFMGLAAVKNKEFNGFNAQTTSVINLFFYLVVFLFVIGLLYFVLRLLKKQSAVFRQGRHFNLIDSIMLNKETSVHLVEMGGRIMVLGTGKEVSLLTFIDDPEIINEITRERIKEDRGLWKENIWDRLLDKIPILKNTNFGTRSYTRDDNSGTASEEEQEISEFEQELKEQLEKLKQLEEKRGGKKDEE